MDDVDGSGSTVRPNGKRLPSLEPEAGGAALQTGRSNRLACVTTSWDDGHPLDLRLANMLMERGVRATFYVPRRAQSPPMSAAQVRELSAHFEIGAHTVTHMFLNACSDERAREEIVGSRKWVEDVTGKPCTMFCPPGGKFDARHVRMMEEAGFAGFRTVELLSLDPPRRRGARLLEMPTSVQAHSHRPLSYGRNIARRQAWRNLWRYVRHGGNAAGDWSQMARSLLDECARCGGTFHLWGHSWEIEAHQQWNRLAQVLGWIGDLSFQLPSVTNGKLCASGTESGAGSQPLQAR